MRHCLFIFLDGVGLGPPGEANPFDARWPALQTLSGGARWTSEAPTRATSGHVFRPIDATLGVEGLPQSGTGQATLFTGVNCAQLVGRHFGPFPHSKTRPVLARRNVFHAVQEAVATEGAPVAFANAYPPRFFDIVQKRDRWTVTTRCCLEADVHIRGIDQLTAGAALTADLTGAGWEKLGHAVPPITEEDAGRRLVRIAQQHAFTLFEYFLTDKAGHGRLDATPATIVQTIDQFLGGVLEALDPRRDLLLITRDHGTREDTTRTTHTRHRVPLVAYGAGATHFASLDAISDVTPAIARAFSGASS